MKGKTCFGSFSPLHKLHPNKLNEKKSRRKCNKERALVSEIKGGYVSWPKPRLKRNNFHWKTGWRIKKYTLEICKQKSNKKRNKSLVNSCSTSYEMEEKSGLGSFSLYIKSGSPFVMMIGVTSEASEEERKLSIKFCLNSWRNRKLMKMPAAEGFYLSWSLSFSVWPRSKHSAKRPHGVQRTTKDFEMGVNFWRKISVLKIVFLKCLFPRPNERMNKIFDKQRKKVLYFFRKASLSSCFLNLFA